MYIVENYKELGLYCLPHYEAFFTLEEARICVERRILCDDFEDRRWFPQVDAKWNPPGCTIVEAYRLGPYLTYKPEYSGGCLIYWLDELQINDAPLAQW